MSKPGIVWSFPRPATDVTLLIALGCKLLGMHGIINERGAREYYLRAMAWSLAGQDDFLDVTWADVAQHIGLTTNVTSEARPRFLSRVGRRIEEDAMARVGLGSPEAPIHELLP